MSPKVFRFGKLRRWYVLVVGLIGLGVLFWLMIMLFIYTSSKGYQLYLSGVTLFMMLLCGYMIWITWSYRIEFLENELKVSRYGIPFARPFHCSYENMSYVRRPIMKGSIEVIPIQGKSFQFPIIVEGGSDAVMDEFEKHLGKEHLQIYLREELKKTTKVGLTNRLFLVGIVWIFLFVQWSPRIILPHVGWETVWGEAFLPMGYINNYWISENGTAWISLMKSFENSQVIRIGDAGTESWVFGNRDDVLHADAIVSGSTGQPWLLRNDFFLHWDGTSWQKIQTRGVEIRADPPIVIGDNFWAIASKENEFSKYLIKLDLNTGDVNLFSIPQELLLDGFHIRDIRLTPDKSIVAYLVKADCPKVFFYIFQNEHWAQSHSLNVQSSDSEFHDEQSRLRFGTFTIDNAGQIWGVNNNDGHPVIGRFDVLTGSWMWSQIPNDCELCSKSYSEMVVDNLGRVWLSGSYGRKNNLEDRYSVYQGSGLDVLKPQWEGTAEQLVRYTDKNSNYQVGIGNTGIRLSQDGHIWVARDRLVWIDSTQPDLPGVMPDWFVTVTNPGKLLIAYIVGFTLIGVLYVGDWIIKRIRTNQKGS